MKSPGGSLPLPLKIRNPFPMEKFLLLFLYG